MGISIKRHKTTQVKRPKKTSKSVLTQVSLKMFGVEPEFTDEVMSISEMIRTLTWYGSVCDKDDAKIYLQEHFKDRPAYVKAFEKVDVQPTYGWVARMIDRGAVIPDIERRKFDAYVEEIIHTASTQKTRKTRSEAVLPTKQVDRTEFFISSFEQAIDKQDQSFHAFQFLKDNKANALEVAKIIQYYRPVVEEVNLATSQKDKQLSKSYSIYSKKEIKSFQGYLEMMLSSCLSYEASVKVTKQRNTRAKTPQQLLRNFRYCVKYEPLGMSSIDPARLIGAMELLVYNVATNVLTVFYAADERGLSVEKSTITNFSAENSCSIRVEQRVREIISEVKMGTQGQRRERFKMAAGERVRTSNRINTNVLLIKEYAK